MACPNAIPKMAADITVISQDKLKRQTTLVASLPQPAVSWLVPSHIDGLAYSSWRAEVAQSVEHMTENHGVGSSILPLGTICFSCPFN